MSLDPMILTRGLPVPDPNFLKPIGTSWNYTGFDSTKFSVEPAYSGSGRALKIDLTLAALTSHTLISSLTPYGVGAGPMSTVAGEHSMRVVFLIIARASGVTENATDLIRAELNGYNAAGTSTGIVCATEALDLGPTDETSWTLFDSGETSVVDPDTRQWALRLRFQDSSPSGASLYLSFAGVGILYGSDAQTYPNDSLLHTYEPQASLGDAVRSRWARPQNATSPIADVFDGGAHKANIALQFNKLTDDEKAIIDRAVTYWNKAQPDAAATALTDYPATRAMPQPVLFALRRPGHKLAYYADVARSGFVNATPRYWPESNARWSSSLTIQERLV